MKTSLQLFLVSFLVLSMSLTGCGDEEKDGDNDTVDLQELPVDMSGDVPTDEGNDTTDVSDADDANDASDSNDGDDTSDDAGDAPDSTDADDMDGASDMDDTADMDEMDMDEMDMMTDPCGDGTCDMTEEMLSPGDMDYCPTDCGVRIVFEVDATGGQIMLPALNNPPPPEGTGTAFIVGNQMPWGPWMPNTAALSDDGTGPDDTADDNIWTGAWRFPVGTVLEYKYTIGDQGDDWSGTEEYMAGNNRGYAVPDDGSAIIRISDVFADQPASAGGQGSLTTVTVESP